MIKKIFLALIILSSMALFGLERTVNDIATNKEYSTFRTDSSDVVFYMVKRDRDLLYDNPKNTANASYSLQKNTFVEFLKANSSGQYLKVRIIDDMNGYVEGWLKRFSVSKKKYYGKSLKNPITEEIKKEDNKNSYYEINPHWVIAKTAIVYGEFKMKNPILELSLGRQVFVLKSKNDILKISIKDKGQYIVGYIYKKNLSRFYSNNGKMDFLNLFKKYDQSLLQNDVITNSFLSYNVIKFSTKGSHTQYIEDKKCIELNNDSLKYKILNNDDLTKIKKKYNFKNNLTNRSYSMYRFLPDQYIKTRSDSMKCKVLELVKKPKEAKVVLDNIDQGKIVNRVIKLYINHIDKLDIDLVVQREEVIYIWEYAYNIKTKVFSKKDYSMNRKIKRIISFKKL